MEELIKKISDNIFETSRIEDELFEIHNVKRGLRNADHSGVVVGMTKVGDVVGYEKQQDGKLKPIPGKLLYRGIEINQIVDGAITEKRTGFEEVAYLLLSGKLPTETELQDFSYLISQTMDIEREMLLHLLYLKGDNIMNILGRSVLEMFIFDNNPEDTSPENTVRQSIELIARFPTIVAYAYNALRHDQGKALHIHHPKRGLSIAENFLYMVKGSKYTPLEVKVLDTTLMVHADHGGGNNSTFAVRVTSSTNTDIYASITAGISSLKGSLHGGANLKVVEMLNNIKSNVKDWTDVVELDNYLKRILNKDAFNKTGLIYGIGHAIYTISDPRAQLLKEVARELAIEKDKEAEFNFMSLIEERSIEMYMHHKGKASGKQVCANVDFYSGFIYNLIGLPKEIFVSLFAMSRITGWCAHRLEELNFKQKRIMRPAYKSAQDELEYVSLKNRIQL